ncbi:ferredoxin [Streptomyces alkaliphilus]|uniref:Ferredoxin n=1 Tax=Streptomyces alkaliphilus TaxID=1472722 RepID=A0A7W3Y175_9ACTN|nr:ferredoxin [Streptomyces alkaliphilus]MBB0244061.1 ferredoxin [Streptomyces alkaliphilus]MQS05683.1 ferredoxin [Streptomyces alkaliphilus]
MKVHADRDRCIGAGLCALNAPSVFDQDDSGLVVVLDDSPSGAEAVDAHKLAEHICPSKAILVSEG